jgi:4-hydroxy-tetrahydrodipicolinate synthase
MRHLQDRLKGCWTSLPTPFTGEGIDEVAFARLVEWQIREGARCLVVAGEAGEGPTLTDVELETLVWIASNVSEGRVSVVAAVLANGTDKAVAMAEVAGRAGADAAMVTVPYYNKPGQPGILAHFEAIAQATDLPLIVHNAPDRTIVDATIDTLATLAGHRNIIGVVDHDPTTGRLFRLRSAVPRGSSSSPEMIGVE